MDNKAIQFVVGAARDLAIQMIEGDLRLRGVSLDALPLQSWFPTVLAATQLNGNLSMVWDAESSRFFFFKRKAWSPLEFQMNLGLKPAGGDIPLSFDGLTFLTPPFFVNPGEGEPLLLSLKPRGFLWLRTDARHGPVGAFSVAADTPPSNNAYTEPTRWNSTWIVNLLKAFESWARGEGSRAEYAVSASTSDGGRLNWLFRSVVEGYERVIRIARFEFSSQDLADQGERLRLLDNRNRNLQRLHPDLGGDYSARIAVKISVWLSQDGSMASRMEKAIKVDLALEAFPVGTSSRLRIIPDMPDYLVDGPSHERIVEAVRERETRQGSFSHAVLSNSDAFDPSQIQAFFRSGELARSVSMLRLQRLPDDEDQEALLFQHEFDREDSWFLFLAKVKDFSQPRPRLDDVKWKGTAKGRNFWWDGARSRELGDYLAGITATLLSWQAKASEGHSA